MTWLSNMLCFHCYHTFNFHALHSSPSRHMLMTMFWIGIILFIKIKASHCTLCVNELEGKCYTRFNADSTWTGARYTCLLKEEKLLVTIDREEVNIFVQRNLNRGNDVWIGLSITNINKPNWKWSDGGNISSYDDWNDSVINSACAVMKYSNTDSSRYWYTMPCHQNRNYICEKENINDNCSDWLSFGNHCYVIIQEHSESNMAAARYCWSNDGYLVSINNRQEAEFIYSNIRANTEYWIGLSPLNWADETPYQWNNWDTSGPNISARCTFMDSVTGLWSAAGCDRLYSRLRRFICQHDIMETTAYSSPSESSIKSHTTAIAYDYISTTVSNDTDGPNDNISQPANANCEMYIGIIATLVVIVIGLVIAMVGVCVYFNRRLSSKAHTQKEPTIYYNEVKNKHGDASAQQNPTSKTENKKLNSRPEDIQNTYEHFTHDPYANSTAIADGPYASLQ